MQLNKISNQEVEKFLEKAERNFKQFLKYCIVGTIGTSIDFSILIIEVKYFKIDPVIAATISFTTSASISFFFYKYWVFNNHIHNYQIQYLKFLTIAVVGLILNTSIMFLFVKIFKFWYLMAKIIATGIVLFWNFLGNKYWSFREKKTVKGKVEEIVSILETVSSKK
jgi:putative flippase GtrA